jgi:hypothetical protein
MSPLSSLDSGAPGRSRLLLVYALLCAASLLYVFVSGYEIFGVEDDPLSALPAMLLALPLSLLLTLLPDLPPTLGVVLLVAFMLVNVAIAVAVREWRLRRRLNGPVRRQTRP